MVAVCNLERRGVNAKAFIGFAFLLGVLCRVDELHLHPALAGDGVFLCQVSQLWHQRCQQRVRFCTEITSNKQRLL